jgi:oligopeptide transport system substrate-binding protein
MATSHCRHSRAGGNPCLGNGWIPACARMTRIVVCGLGLAALLALSGCGGSSSEQSRPSGNVLIERWAASAGDPAALDPAHAIYTLPQASIPYALFDQLMTYDKERREVVPMLAASATPNDAATVWTFVLRPDAIWHNGDPVLPSDVKYAWERIVNPKTASRWAALFSSVKGYEAFRSGAAGGLSGVSADDSSRTLTVELESPFSEFAGLVTLLPFSPVPAKQVEALTAGRRWDDQIMTGSGAFRMGEPWRHGRDVRLVRFDRYYAQPAALEAIEFRVAKDVDASFTELEAGIAQIAFMPPSRYAEIKARGDLDVIDDPMSATWYIGFNMQEPTVGGPQNQLLREAIALAIDRQAIVDIVYQGGRRIGYTLTPPEVPGHDAATAPVLQRDVAAAREKLAAWGGPGKLAQPIKFIYNIGSGQENVASIIKANLQEIGVAVELKSFDSAQFASEILKPETMMFRQLITYTYPSADAGLYALLHSKSVGTNLPRYSNTAVDALLDQARGTLDTLKRNALYVQAESIALREYAVVPVFQYKAAGVTSKKLRGVAFMPGGYMVYEKAQLQK